MFAAPSSAWFVTFFVDFSSSSFISVTSQKMSCQAGAILESDIKGRSAPSADNGSRLEQQGGHWRQKNL